jgi:zinc protease
VYAINVVHKPNFTGAQLVAQVEEELGKLIKEGVPPAELERARTFLRAQRVGEMQSSYRRAGLLAQYELFDSDPDLINTEMDRLLAVTPAQVQTAAKNLFAPQRKNVLEIVPAPKAEGK